MEARSQYTTAAREGGREAPAWWLCHDAGDKAWTPARMAPPTTAAEARRWAWWAEPSRGGGEEAA